MNLTKMLLLACPTFTLHAIAALVLHMHIATPDDSHPADCVVEYPLWYQPGTLAV